VDDERVANVDDYAAKLMFMLKAIAKWQEHSLNVHRIDNPVLLRVQSILDSLNPHPSLPRGKEPAGDSWQIGVLISDMPVSHFV
jgi:hypothetical protein